LDIIVVKLQKVILLEMLLLDYLNQQQKIQVYWVKFYLDLKTPLEEGVYEEGLQDVVSGTAKHIGIEE